MEFFWPLSGVAFMARYEQSYVGGRRTASVHVQLTPDERAELEAAAAEGGLRPQRLHPNALLAAPCGRRPRRWHPPQSRCAPAHYELNAIGNNLNQLTRIANTLRAMPAADELRAVTGLLKATMARVIAL